MTLILLIHRLIIMNTQTSYHEYHIILIWIKQHDRMNTNTDEEVNKTTWISFISIWIKQHYRMNTNTNEEVNKFQTHSITIEEFLP